METLTWLYSLDRPQLAALAFLALLVVALETPRPRRRSHHRRRRARRGRLNRA